MMDIQLKKRLKDAEGDMPLDVALQFKPGDFIALFGPSGSGKTSILRMLAGLMKPDEGHITMNDIDWYHRKSRTYLSPQQRSVGFLFQDYALFPNMTVRKNLLYALEKGQPKSGVDEIIELTDLGQLADRKPETLSGGQKQRVALARALVQRPSLLLLDEPLSALDMRTRRKLQQLILELHKELNLTIVLVSHDISEVIRMTDQVFVLERGVIIDQGAPIDLFAQATTGSKFQVIGTLIDTYHQDFIVILTILIGKQVVRLAVTDDEAAELQIGDTVQVVSKAFNPIVSKISS